MRLVIEKGVRPLFDDHVDPKRGRTPFSVTRAMLVRIAAIVFAIAAARCSASPPNEPLQLERNVLTVDNHSSRDWSSIEIWLNTHYRVTTSSIPAGGRFQVPLDAFVNAYGKRFEFAREQVNDLRLTAKLPDGEPLELKKQFELSGLAGALGGKR